MQLILIYAKLDALCGLLVSQPSTISSRMS